jgi:CubicO group peptidase (beta-lactamase class C family)
MMAAAMRQLKQKFYGLVLIAGLPLLASADIDTAGLTAFTERGMQMWNVPGMSVAVVNDDEVLFRKGFGVTDIEGGQAVDEHTRFAIASTTKAMVVAGILILADEGRLSLDDPIVKLIPELHFHESINDREIMVRDLLAHRTGLPSTDFWTFFQGMPLAEQLERLAVVERAAPVRTRLIYQNTMFEIAGLLIERISGEQWQDFLDKRLWQPIGMTETHGARGMIDAGEAHVTPYMFRDGELKTASWDFPADLADAAGSVWSSIRDMSLWAQFLLNGGVTRDDERLISEQGISQMFEPQQLASANDFYPTTQLTEPAWRSYGLGWFQQDFQGRKIDFHTGSLSGLIAIIGLDRQNMTAVIVLGNRDHAEMRHALLWHVMDASAPGEKRDWNQAVFDLYAEAKQKGDTAWQELQDTRLANTRLSLPLDAYAGTYRNAMVGDVLIEKSATGLALKTPRVVFDMSHWHADTFLVEYKQWEMREFAAFRINPEGSITSVEMFDQIFERVEEE